MVSINSMKKLILTAFGLFAIVLFFLLPRNHTWFNNRIIGYWNDFKAQRLRLDLEERRMKRWGNSYILAKQIADYISHHGNKNNSVVLLPPSAYFKAKGVDFHVPEPAVFYYYTGLKSVWVDIDRVSEANWIVSAEDGKLKITEVNDKNILKDSVSVFRKYPVSL